MLLGGRLLVVGRGLSTPNAQRTDSVETKDKGPGTKDRFVPDLSFSEQLTVAALGGFFTLWVFALGAALGSFLNVVVYRMPRGIPLGLSVSRCPKCANPIAFRDNVPILSWLWLRGRCRSCGQGISPRYPLVEGAFGGFVLLLFCLELLTGGRNLPLRLPDRPGFMSLLVTTPWELIGLAAVHGGLLYLLLGMALIEADRRVVPWKLIGIGVLCGIVMSPFHLLTVSGELSPAMGRAPVTHGEASLLAQYGPGALAAGVGLLAGLAWGLLLASVGRPEGNRRRAAMRRALPATMMLVGVALGWQAATTIALVVVVLRGIGWLVAAIWPGWSRVPATGYVLAATLLQIVTWRWQEAIPHWPASAMNPWMLAVVLAAGLLAAMASTSRSGESDEKSGRSK